MFWTAARKDGHSGAEKALMARHHADDILRIRSGDMTEVAQRYDRIQDRLATAVASKASGATATAVHASSNEPNCTVAIGVQGLARAIA